MPIRGQKRKEGGSADIRMHVARVTGRDCGVRGARAEQLLHLEPNNFLIVPVGGGRFSNVRTENIFGRHTLVHP